jgi:alpha-L-fucosidase
MFSWSTSISTLSPLVSITLPEINSWNRLHLFAMTLVPSDLYDEPFLHFRNIKLTTKWRMIRGARAYAVEALMGSYLPTALAPDRLYWIDMPWFVVIDYGDIHTIEMGKYSRAMPGDQILVTVWVSPRDEESFGGDTYQILRRSFQSGAVSVTARAEGTNQVVRQEMKMEIESDELVRDIPEWFENAKFGIFMHWGVYAVPGWARRCISITFVPHVSQFRQLRALMLSGTGMER